MNLLVDYEVISGEASASTKVLLHCNANCVLPETLVHSYFKKFWGEDRTVMDQPPYLYYEKNWHQMVRVTGFERVPAKKYEMLKDYLPTATLDKMLERVPRSMAACS